MGVVVRLGRRSGDQGRKLTADIIASDLAILIFGTGSRRRSPVRRNAPRTIVYGDSAVFSRPPL